MSRRFSNSKGLASAIGASNYNGLASAVGTTTREYLTEDGKKVKETDYYIKFRGLKIFPCENFDSFTS